MEARREDVCDTVRIARAATWTSPKPAPATRATITRLYSISLPVCSVWSQKSKVSATWPQKQTRRSRNAPSCRRHPRSLDFDAIWQLTVEKKLTKQIHYTATSVGKRTRRRPSALTLLKRK